MVSLDSQIIVFSIIKPKNLQIMCEMHSIYWTSMAQSYSCVKRQDTNTNEWFVTFGLKK